MCGGGGVKCWISENRESHPCLGVSRLSGGEEQANATSLGIIKQTSRSKRDTIVGYFPPLRGEKDK